MAYLNLILLLPLYYLLPVIGGLQIDIDQVGIFHYTEEPYFDHVPICFVTEEDLPECSPGQQPSMSSKTVIQDESSARKSKKKRVEEIYIIWPNLIYEPQGQINTNVLYIYPYSTSWPVFNNGYWTINPIYTITSDGKTTIYREETKDIYTGPLYRSAKGRHSKKETTNEFIPFNVTGCIPVNNTICEKSQIEQYQKFLESKETIVKQTSVVKGSSSARMESKTEEVVESYTDENEELETEEEDQNETTNEIDDSSSIQIATQEFAEEIGKSVVRRLKQVTTTRCPVTIHTLDVVVNQEENCKPKLESIDVQLKNNVTNKSESSARSRLHYKAGQKRFRINL